MNITIHKYPEIVDDIVVIQTHEGAELLEIEIQRGILCFWFMVDTDAPRVERIYNVIGTGNPVPTSTGRHVGTVHQEPWVWHIFERVGSFMAGERPAEMEKRLAYEETVRAKHFTFLSNEFGEQK